MSKRRMSPEAEVERWHFTPLDDPSPHSFVPPTVEQIAEIEAAAREDGYRQGFGQGLHDGQLRLKIMSALVDSFQLEIQKLDAAVGHELVALATEIARRVVEVELKSDVTLLPRMIERALQSLPSTLEPTRLLVNPQDLDVISQYLEHEFAGRKLSFIPDPTIGPGGCKLLTATSTIDATLETRWARITTMLDADPWRTPTLPEKPL